MLQVEEEWFDRQAKYVLMSAESRIGKVTGEGILKVRCFISSTSTHP
jgi:hypothetical protein